MKDGKLVKIEEEDRGVVCAGCGEPLVPHKGKKRGWYFAHRPGCKECTGSARAVVLQLMFDSFEKMPEYTIPQSHVSLLNGLYTYPGVTIKVEKVVKEQQGVLLNDKYYITPYSGGKRNTPLPYEYVVVIDTADMEKHIDEITELRAFEFFAEGELAYSVQSPELTTAREVYESSKYERSGEYFICPASMVIDNSRLTVMSKAQCRKCPFQHKGICLGAGCIKDFEKDAFDGRSVLERYEDYHMLLPKELGIVKFHFENPFGRCTKCGTEMELAQGNYGQRIPNVFRIKDRKEEAAFVRCPNCGEVQGIYCPECKEQRMNVRRKGNTDTVFLQCKQHYSERYTESKKDCNGVLSTITVWRDMNKPKEFADEILAVGNVTKPVKGAREAMLKVRGKKS